MNHFSVCSIADCDSRICLGLREQKNSPGALNTPIPADNLSLQNFSPNSPFSIALGQQKVMELKTYMSLHEILRCKIIQWVFSRTHLPWAAHCFSVSEKFRAVLILIFAWIERSSSSSWSDEVFHCVCRNIPVNDFEIKNTSRFNAYLSLSKEIFGRNTIGEIRWFHRDISCLIKNAVCVDVEILRLALEKKNFLFCSIFSYGRDEEKNAFSSVDGLLNSFWC